MIRPTLFVAILLAARSGHAQAPMPLQTQASPEDIAAMSSVLQYARGSLDIVTLAQPRKRLSCHVDNLTSDALLCKRSLTHKEQRIALNDIVAVIEPPHSKSRVTGGLILAAVALGTTVLFIDPVLAFVGVAIIAPIMIIHSFSPPAPPPYDSHDLLLFKRSGLPLLVPLS